MTSKLAMSSVMAAALLSCVCSRTESGKDSTGLDAVARDAASGFSLDDTRAGADLAELTQAPHPFGAPRQLEITSWLASRITEMGLTSARESFSATVPNPAALDVNAGPISATQTKDGTNIYALNIMKSDAPCVVAIASHYDTKIVSGVDYVGANDSGSSSVLLLQLLGYLKTHADKVDVTCDIIGIWFDGEESVLTNWTDGEMHHPAKIQDNTYGSRFGAGRTTACTYNGKVARCLPTDLGGKPIMALILMDMIGSPGLLISRDRNSTKDLVALAAQGAEALDLQDHLAKVTTSIEDDHVPYLKIGVPALDFIDFNHLQYWHRAGDDAPQVAMESLKIAGRIALYTALATARSPKVLVP